MHALKEALACIWVCSKLEDLLLKKKSLNNGDSYEVHAQKLVKFPSCLHLAAVTCKERGRGVQHRINFSSDDECEK
ncbi:hypothetical protein LguiA_021733 [Lonicera macranthoides]